MESTSMPTTIINQHSAFAPLTTVSEKVMETFQETPECNMSDFEPCEDAASTQRILKKLKIDDQPVTRIPSNNKLMKTSSFCVNRSSSVHRHSRKPRSVSFTFSNEQYGSLSAKNLLLSNRRDSLNAGFSYGMSELMMAARDGNLQLAQQLLENNADPNMVDKRGFDALMYAVRDGHENIAKLLLDSKRVAINTRTKHGLSHILYAAINGHTNCLKLLISSLKQEEMKEVVNMPDDCGFTALMGAAQNGHVEAVKLLLDFGADLEQKDKHGMTALFWAVTSNMLDVVNLLIQYGADVNTRERKDKTPLLYTVVKGQTTMAKTLLNSGAIVCERVRLFCLMDQVKQAKVKEGITEGDQATAAVSSN